MTREERNELSRINGSVKRAKNVLSAAYQLMLRLPTCEVIVEDVGSMTAKNIDARIAIDRAEDWCGAAIAAMEGAIANHDTHRRTHAHP